MRRSEDVGGQNSTIIRGRTCRRASLPVFLWLGLALAACNSLVTQEDGAPVEPADFATETRLVPPEPGHLARFGDSVALGNDTLAVGAWGESRFGDESGTVYLYDRESEGWKLQQALTAADASAGARFGHSVELEDSILVVGAVYDSEAGDDAGAAYVFERTGESWQQVDKLAGGAAGSRFGQALSLDGQWLAVAAPGPGTRGVHVYRRLESGYQHVQLLEPADPSILSRFGGAVEIEGRRLLVGEWTDSEAEVGKVHVYRLSGSEWQKIQTIESEEPEDRFGFSLDLDGEQFVVGAPDSRSRPVRIYRFLGERAEELPLSFPTQQARLLGTSVTLQGDLVAASDPAFGEEPDHAGRVTLMDVGSAASGYVYPEDQEAHKSFGISLAAHGDVLVVGATGDETDGVVAGSVYVYSNLAEEAGHSSLGWGNGAVQGRAGAEVGQQIVDADE